MYVLPIGVCVCVSTSGGVRGVYSQVFIYRRPYLPLRTSRANTEVSARAMHKNVERHWSDWRDGLQSVFGRCIHARIRVTFVALSRLPRPLRGWRHARARARYRDGGFFNCRSNDDAISNLRDALLITIDRAFSKRDPRRPQCVYASDNATLS